MQTNTKNGKDFYTPSTGGSSVTQRQSVGNYKTARQSMQGNAMSSETNNAIFSFMAFEQPQREDTGI